MTLTVDIIALIFVGIIALVAFLRGFIKTFFGFMSVIIAIVLAVLFYKPLGDYIRKTTDIDEWLYESIVSLNDSKEKEENASNSKGKVKQNTILKDLFSGEQSGENVTKTITDDVDFSSNFQDMLDSLPESMYDSLSSTINFKEKKSQLIINIASKVSIVVVDVLAWVVIYVALRIILLILMLVLESLTELPVLKTINNLAGLVLGIIMGIFRLYVILAIIYFISNVASIDGVVNKIQDSMVVSHMYNHNILLYFIFHN